MNENAYKSPMTVDPPRRTRGIRWAIWSGIACLAVAAPCAILTLAVMIISFRDVAQASGPPRTEDLAEGISFSLIPAFGVLPFGLVGVALLIIGLAIRRPIQEQD